MPSKMIWDVKDLCSDTIFKNCDVLSSENPWKKNDSFRKCIFVSQMDFERNGDI